MSESASEAGPIDVLWTGGWDSTFQLLRLLTVQKVPVRPIYLIDEERRSMAAELRTMKRIRGHIRAHAPGAAQLLAPTSFYSVADLEPNPVVAAAYRRVIKAVPLGGQYEWLARFAEEQALVNVQMGTHKGGNVDTLIRSMARPTVDGGGATFTIPAEFAYTDEHTLFGRFSHPLLELTKPEMGRIASEFGLTEILNTTWFCHNPKSGMKPCGMCNTCLGAIAHGNGWRIPPERRVLSVLARAVIRPSRRLARNVWHRVRR